MTQLPLVPKNWLHLQCACCRHQANVPVARFIAKGLQTISQIKSKSRCSNCDRRGEVEMVIYYRNEIDVAHKMQNLPWISPPTAIAKQLCDQSKLDGLCWGSQRRRMNAYLNSSWSCYRIKSYDPYSQGLAVASCFVTRSHYCYRQFWLYREMVNFIGGRVALSPQTTISRHIFW